MAIGCNCSAGLSNTGQPNCVTLQSVTSKLILVPLKANDGTLNRITLATPITATTFTSLTNHLDPSKRWYPVGAFENVEMPKADSIFEEANSGRKAFLRQGVRSFAGELWSNYATPQFLGKLLADRCVAFGVYIIDVNGNLVGSNDGTYLSPIPVDNASFDPKLMFATDSTTGKIMVAFDFDRLFDESTLWIITPTEGLIDFNILTGLMDVNFTNIVTSGLTAFTFKAVLSYGTAINPLLYTGALTTEWILTNYVTGVVLPATTTETSVAGTYTITPTAPFVAGTQYKLRVNKVGFDGARIWTA